MRNTVHVNHGVDWRAIKNAFKTHEPSGPTLSSKDDMKAEVGRLDKLQYRESIIIANRRMTHASEPSGH